MASFLGARPAHNSLNWVWNISTLSWDREVQPTGGGGGGGAVTIADGADVAQGTTTDVAWVAGAGTVISLLKKIASAGGGAVSIADGADVAEGTTTDAAVVSDAAGTLSGKLRGLVKILASVWDSANGRLKVDGSAVTQPISAAALPLPTGASTAARQDTGNTSLASIDGKLTAPQVTTGTITLTGNLAMTFNAPMAAASIVIPDAGSGANVANFLFEGTVDGVTWAVIFGTRIAHESAGVNPLMVNDIQLNRDFGQYIFAVAGLTAIRARCYANTGGSFPTRIVAYPTAVDNPGTVIFGGNAARIPLVVNADGSVTAVLSNGITGLAYGNGGSGGANSLRVTIADDSTPIGAINETAPATDTASSGLNGRLQRIAQRLTTAIGNQTTELASLASIDGKLTAPLAISATALPLPTGAATEVTLGTRVADATVTARLGTLGQKTMAGSTPVVIASDQGAIPITGSISATSAATASLSKPQYNEGVSTALSQSLTGELRVVEDLAPLLLDVLNSVLVELRIQNTVLHATLNSRDDLDLLRKNEFLMPTTAA